MSDLNKQNLITTYDYFYNLSLSYQGYKHNENTNVRADKIQKDIKPLMHNVYKVATLSEKKTFSFFA